MTIAPTPSEALRLAVAIAGTQARLAAACGCGQPLISKLIRRNKPLNAELVLKAEAATGVSRHLLRPDIYPPEICGTTSKAGRAKATKLAAVNPGLVRFSGRRASL